MDNFEITFLVETLQLVFSCLNFLYFGPGSLTLVSEPVVLQWVRLVYIVHLVNYEQYRVSQYSALHYSRVQYTIIQYNTAQHSTASVKHK